MRPDVLHWLRRFRLRVRATFWGERDRELRAELQFHLRSLEDEYTQQGLTADEARRRARHEFGNPATLQDASHDLFAFRPIEDLGHDFRHAWRETRRSAAFTAVAVISLAVGISAAAATFVIVDAAIVRPLPVRLPQQLVAFTMDGRDWARWSYSAFLRWRYAPSRLADVAASAETEEIDLRPGGTSADTARVSLASGNYFEVLGADVSMGRRLTEEDAREDRPVVVISDAFWRRRFGRSSDVLAKAIDLRGVRYDIVGVARRGFTGHQTGYPVDVWAPLARNSSIRPGTSALLDVSPANDTRWLTVIGRLHPDVNLAQASAAAELARQTYVSDQADLRGDSHPTVVRDRSSRVQLVPGARGDSRLRHDRLRRPLLILAGISALVLLVAYANFMNLMLARSESRRRELSIRVALGASGWRVIRQSAAESVLLVSGAAAMALIVTAWVNRASHALVVSVLAADLDLTLGLRQAALICVASALAAVCGLWTSAGRARANAWVAGTSGPLAAGSSRAMGARRVLLAGQLALCVVLLIGAGLLLRTVLNLRSQDLGLDRSALLVPVSIDRGEVHGSAEAAVAVMRARLAAIPGVQAVGLSGAALLDFTAYWIDGSQRLTTDRGVALAGVRWTFAAVGEGFFDASGMTLVRGREFTSADTASDANVVVLNHTLARFLFGAADPIGRRIALHPRSPMQTVIGIVNDARQVSPRDRGIGVVYQRMRTFGQVTFAVRPVRNANANPAFIARHAESIAAEALAGRVRSVSEVLDRAIVQERVMSGVALVLAVLVVAVGCVGVYALMSYEVTRRTHELGVRFALGASRAQVVAIVLRDAMTIVCAALVCGLPLGVAASRVFSSQLYGVTPADPWTLSAVAVALVAVTIAAASKPARAAAQIDPLVLLRHE
jgi:predicted permease